MPIDAYEQIGQWFDIDGDKLRDYAAEDTMLGGVEGNPAGTSYAADGHLLYAFVRYFKPLRVLEIGTDHGGSAKHMANACKRNKCGHVWTVDINPDTGDGLVEADKKWITQVKADAALWIPAFKDEPFDFIFEDGPHSEYICHVVYENLRTILKPQCYILSHDVTTGVAEPILNGIRKGGCAMDTVKIVNTSPLGFSIYQFTEATYQG